MNESFSVTPSALAKKRGGCCESSRGRACRHCDEGDGSGLAEKGDEVWLLGLQDKIEDDRGEEGEQGMGEEIVEVREEEEEEVAT